MGEGASSRKCFVKLKFNEICTNLKWILLNGSHIVCIVFSLKKTVCSDEVKNAKN